MTDIAGVDTIQGLVGEPPRKIRISKDIIRTAEKVRGVWNRNHLAFIPYCFKCRVAVNWVQPPEDGVIFRCPNCKREWEVV